MDSAKNRALLRNRASLFDLQGHILMGIYYFYYQIMEQQTPSLTSIETNHFSHTRCSSLLVGDPKQVGLVFLKSALTRKLQQLFSISFRKISTKNHSASTSRLRQRHRDCIKSIQQSERKPPSREKSQTQRHSASCFQILDELVTYSEDVKIVLNEINKCERLSQIVDAQKRMGEVIVIESKRLEKIRSSSNKGREKSKVYDMQLGLNCIEKLLKFIGDTGNGNQQILSLKAEIELLQQKLEQIGKPNKQKDAKAKGDENSVTKQIFKAVQTLVTIMKDHKIANIKRKIEQQSKKFTQTRKQLFEGVLASISKAEAAQQSNLSQITQLSSKLLEEQPSVEKNIAHIQKQKRVFEKMLCEAKGEQNKAAYYNLIDTSIYLAKLFNSLKQKEGGSSTQQISRIKSPPRIRKPITNKSAAKQKPCLVGKPKTTRVETIESFKMQQSQSKEQESLKGQLISCVEYLQEMRCAVVNEQPLKGKGEGVERHNSEGLKKIVELFYDIIEHSKRQNQVLKDFIETLNSNVQNLRKNEEILQQEVESQKQVEIKLKTVLQRVASLVDKDGYQEVPSEADYEALIQRIQQLALQGGDQRKLFQQSQPNPQADLEYLVQQAKLQIGSKNDQISFLKNTIENLSGQILELKQQINCSSRDDTQVNDLRLQIDLLKSQNSRSIETQQQIVQSLQSTLSQSNFKIKTLEQRLQKCLDESARIVESIKQQHLDQKHAWELETTKCINREKELLNKNTALESDIFLYQREIESLKNQFDKAKSEISQEDVVNSLRQQNAILREDVIQKGKIIFDLESGQKSPRSLKPSVTGSLRNIIESEEVSFKKKTSNSSADMLKEFRPNNPQMSRLVQQKTLMESEIRHMKEKVGIMNLQRTRDEGIISELRKQVKSLQSHLNASNSQNEKLRSDVGQFKKLELKLRQRLREYETEQGSMIMKSNKWNDQLYLDSLDVTKSPSALEDRAAFLKKIDSLQGQLYNQGSRLLKSNAMREQDLRILMSQNQLLQEQVKQINIKLANERTKLMISPNILEDLENSMKKMELQLSKLKHEGIILKDQLRSIGNPEASYVQQLTRTPSKPSYQFVTNKFSSRVKKTLEHPVSPKGKMQNQLKDLQREKQSLASRVKLLSVFTIIDEENKAFVHNINKIISSVLDFLSTAEEFQECDYTDVDYMTTLSEYLSHEDYEGYFQTLETFFKDLFLNVFERKNNVMAKQTDQLLFLKDKMEELLSEKIDEIEQEEQKLNYSQRTPLKSYNEEKSRESIPHLQHLLKLFVNYKDPKILRQMCHTLNVSEGKEYY